MAWFGRNKRVIHGIAYPEKSVFASISWRRIGRALVLVLGVVMLLLGTGAIGFFGYRFIKEANRAPEDTAELRALAPQFGYEASIAHIKQQAVPPEGFRFVVVGDTRSDIVSAALVFQQIA